MPGLLDLRTDLKSLKYGNDQPGNGSSGQPYIKTDINTVDRDFNRFRLTKFDDGLIRGGAIGALNASVTDTLRIGKFLVDFPKGPLFIVKQVGLQLSNPRLEAKQLPIDRPTTGGGFFNNVGNFISNTANRIENAVGPTRIYNLGINTLAQVPVNAFGGHIVRHGFTPISDPSKYYEAVVTQNNIDGTNRLERLRTELGLINQRPRALQKRETPIRLEEFGLVNPYLNRFGPDPTEPETDPNLAPSLSDLVYQRLPPPTNQSFAIAVGGVIPSLSYTGGPNSVYGLGRTEIRRSSNTENRSLIEKAFSKSTQFSGRAIGENGEPTDINYPGTLGVSRVYFKTAEDIEKNTGISLDNPTQKPSWGDQSVFKEGYVLPNNDRAYEGFLRKINETQDYEITKTTGSIFTDLGFKLDNLWPNSVVPDVSFTYTANKIADIQQSKDKASNALTDAENGNDIVANGPSTYSNILDPQLSGSFKYVDLSVPNISPVYSNPALATYAELQRKLAPTLTPKQQITLDRTSTDYKYNSGKLTYTEFNRTNDVNIDDDTLALRFTPINPFTGLKYEDAPLKFLAYITEYSDNFDSTWNDIKYVGRGESFYIFNGFKRSANLGFNIPCYSQENLLIQHTKLNQLVSILAGDYNTEGLLGGIITRLTVGNYINNQPGIINNLSFQPIENSSWDLDKKLAFYIKVSFGFTLIHNFVPRYGKRFINVVTGSGGNEVIVDNPLKTTADDPSINIPAGQRGPGNTFVP
jgi:hypothetical protein